MLTLFLLLCTAYLLLAGTRPLRSAADLSQFGASVFALLGPLQMAVLAFAAAVGSAVSVSQEKDRRTLLLLMMTRLNAFELVAGKLAAAVLQPISLLVAAVPLFICLTLFGGVSLLQVGLLFVVTLATVLVAAAVGTVNGFWREKTFQTLVATILALGLWIAVGEGLVAVGGPAQYVSPVRAVATVTAPIAHAAVVTSLAYSGICLILAVLITSIGIARVRIWNPSREVRVKGAAGDATTTAEPSPESSQSWRARRARPMWDYPILWREVRTWAYGRKVVLIRAGYVLFCLAAAALLWNQAETGELAERAGSGMGRLIPAATFALAPLAVISIAIVNTLAVNSITSERDVLSLDLLLVTDISPREFIVGKLLGVFYVTKEVVLLPILLLAAVWWLGGLSGENFVYATLGLLVLYLFAVTLGIHCGLNYALSRSSILTSLGTTFFLCLGVATCMVVMVSFRGAFGLQLAPFLTIILGGGAGLYAALGWRRPSTAIFIASLALPALTFYGITTFLLQRDQLPVLLAITVGYGFATAAMLVPAVSEFDVAMGRTRGGGGGEDAE